MLFPPLSHLEVVGNPRLEMLDKKQVLVLPTKVNINQKMMTIEEILSQRKHTVISMRNSVLSDVDFDLRFISKITERLSRSLKSNQPAATNIMRVFQDVKVKLGEITEHDAEWFNNDANLIKAVTKCQDLRLQAYQDVINEIMEPMDGEVSPL